MSLARLFEEQGDVLSVDRHGRVFISSDDGARRLDGQAVLSSELLHPVAPFSSEEGLRGRDLRAPRPHLRIVPGKLGGSPHVEDTRIETIALGALAARGLDASRIARLYPAVDTVAIAEAIELEGQLAANLRLAVAA